jgi:hypothetical protein
VLTIEDLHPDDLRGLLERALRSSKGSWGRGEKCGRREEFRLRALALSEQQEDIVKPRIGEVFVDPAIILEVQGYARSIFNPLKRVTRRVATAYKTPPNRRIDGASKKLSKTFAKLLRRVRFDMHCKRWNELQVGMNTIIVLVVPRRQSDGTPICDFEVVTGAEGEVWLDPDAPFADAPAVLAYSIRPHELNVLRAPAPGEEVLATVDGRWWVFWDSDFKPVRVVEHGLGRFPGAVLRGTLPTIRTPDGWWDPYTGRAAVQTVADVGLAAATMAWTRKTQFGHLIALLRGGSSGSGSIGEADEHDDERDQKLGHPESVLELEGSDIQLLVNDIDKGVQNFKGHIDYLTAELAEVMVGSSSVLNDPQPGQAVADLAVAAQHAALRERQEDQVSGLRSFEEDLHLVHAMMATRIRCPWAVPPEAIEDLEVQFAALPFLDTPDNRLEHAIKATKFGTTDQVEYLQEQHDLTEEAAEERAVFLAQRKARLHEILAVHETPADATEEPDPGALGESKAARTGRAGGRARPPAQPAA